MLSQVGEPLEGVLAQGGERLGRVDVLRGRREVVVVWGRGVQVLKGRLHISRVLNLVLAQVVWQVYRVSSLCPQTVIGP